METIRPLSAAVNTYEVAVLRMAIERTLPIPSLIDPLTVRLVNVPTLVIAGCAAVVTVPAVVADTAETALATNVLVLNQTVTAPVDVDTDVPELPASVATPIPPITFCA
jgi:hypothetical protein